MGTLKMKPAYYLYLLPALALFAVFFVVPFVQTVFISLQDWDSINEMEFIGFSNYMEMFRDEVFVASVGRVLKYALIQVVVQIALGLLFAALLGTHLVGGRKNRFLCHYCCSDLAGSGDVYRHFIIRASGNFGRIL